MFFNFKKLLIMNHKLRKLLSHKFTNYDSIFCIHSCIINTSIQNSAYRKLPKFWLVMSVCQLCLALFKLKLFYLYLLKIIFKCIKPSWIIMWMWQNNNMQWRNFCAICNRLIPLFKFIIPNSLVFSPFCIKVKVHVLFSSIDVCCWLGENFALIRVCFIAIEWLLLYEWWLLLLYERWLLLFEWWLLLLYERWLYFIFILYWDFNYWCFVLWCFNNFTKIETRENFLL